MLSQDDRRHLAELERRLRAEDPEFVARMSGRRPRPKPIAMIVVCALVWLVVAVAAFAGWWPAASVLAGMAVLSTGALGYAARRHDQD
jgi:Flp pilus assembly protein TadB